MRVNELHGRIGRSSSTRRGLGLEALKHAPSVWVPERCRPLRFDRLSFTTRRRLLGKYRKREALLCEPWDPEVWSGDDYFG